MIRRFDEPIRPGIRYRPRPGAYGILRRGNRLLITFQTLPAPEFQLPGGGVDAGESPQAALHREVREETGWVVQIERRMGAFQRYTLNQDNQKWIRKVCQIYLCRPIRQRWPIAEPHHANLWVRPDEAVTLLTNAGDRHFVRRLIGNGTAD